MPNDRIRNSVISAAMQAAINLHATADRLRRAAEAHDFYTLSEISFSGTSWPLDQIRGAALVIARSEASKDPTP